jgi:acyl-CoA synthetase (AMP-forming)/AMP-acid ligase II
LTLNTLLDRSVARWGSRPFLVDADGEVSYEEFSARVEGLTGALRDLEISAGDAVVTVLQNEPEMLVLWFALARLGAVMLPINPALPAAKCEGVVRACQPRAVVGSALEIERYGELVEGLRITVGDEVPPGAVRFDDLSLPSDTPFADRSEPWDPCVALQTSGTTGDCKGALLSQFSFTRPALEFCRWMEVTEEDRFLACLPLFHLAGQAFAVSAVAGGASLVLVDRFSASRFWGDVRSTGATLVRHLGEMLAVLCARRPAADDRDHSLRAVYGGGARKEVEEEFARRFGVAVVEGYGLTETNTVLRNELRSRRPGSIGREVPYCRVRVVDELGRPTAPGRTGELQVERNPVMMLGYVGGGGEDSFDGNWFRTGDLGYRDADGWYYFVGRSKQIIRRRGENIFPAQIEEVIRRHPAVAEVAAIGVADRYGGEDIKVLVVPVEGYTIVLASLAEWCKDHLAEFQIPRYWHLCTELPRTETNKIHWHRLDEFRSGVDSFDREAVVLSEPSVRSAPTLPAQGVERRP